MTHQEVKALAGHRAVPPWIMKLVSDAIAIEVQREREACAKICEDQQIRSAEASKKAKRVTDSKLYHHCSVTAGWNAAAIRVRWEPTSRGEAT